MGYAMTDVNSPDIGIKERDLLVRKQRLGLAYHGASFNVAADLVTQAPFRSLNIGAEQWLAQGRVAARSGLILGNRDLKHLTMGFSLKAATLLFDYAFRFPLSGIDATSGTHRLTLTIRFGRKPKRSLVEGHEFTVGEDEVLLRRELEHSKKRERLPAQKADDLTAMQHNPAGLARA